MKKKSAAEVEPRAPSPQLVPVAVPKPKPEITEEEEDYPINTPVESEEEEEYPANTPIESEDEMVPEQTPLRIMSSMPKPEITEAPLTEDEDEEEEPKRAPPMPEPVRDVVPVREDAPAPAEAVRSRNNSVPLLLTPSQADLDIPGFIKRQQAARRPSQQNRTGLEVEVREGPRSRVTVDASSHGMRRGLSYMPEEASGTYEVHIFWNGVPVPGSPFMVPATADV
jgi:hypothetical protein